VSIGEEADLRISGPLHDYLVEFKLESYTITDRKSSNEQPSQTSETNTAKMDDRIQRQII
jgi:hypothetical protein